MVPHKTALRGFSLVELMMAMLLFSMVVLFGALSMRNVTNSSDAHALALVVTEQLRVARQTAISTRQPVAIMLPTGAGTLPTTQTLYVATGQSMAHVTKVVNLATDNPGSEIFAGLWPVSTGQFGIFPVLNGFRDGNYPVAPWLANSNFAYNMTQDYALVFMPDGGVTSNGLPYYNGAYYLVTVAGASYSAAAPPTSGNATISTLEYYSLTAAVHPWAISVTPSGQIRASAGLPQLQGPFSEDSAGAVVPGASPPPLASLPAFAPAVQSVTISPPPQYQANNATLAAGQQITLAVTATDPSGHDLFLQWSAIPNNGNQSYPSVGNFSVANPEPMTWDPVNQVWTSTWNWVTPLNASPGDQFTFQCSLGCGLTGQIIPSASQTLAIVSTQKFYASSYITLNGLNSHWMYKCNVDGSHPVAIATVPNASLTGVSVDGTKVLSSSYWGFLGYFLYNAQTGKLLQSGVFPGANGPAYLSPLGDKVAYWATGPGGNQSIVVMNMDGTSATNVLTGMFAQDYYGTTGQTAWSPDESQLAVIGGNWPTATLYVVNTSNPANLVPGLNVRAYQDAQTGNLANVMWLPDNQTVEMYENQVYWPPAFGFNSANILYQYDSVTNALSLTTPIASPQVWWPTAGGGFAWTIAADGSKIYLTSNFSGAATIYETPLTPVGGQWSPPSLASWCQWNSAPDSLMTAGN